MSKSILIIGAGPGIGFATAERFAEDGYRIVLASRNPERLRDEAAKTLGEFSLDNVDVADASSLMALLSRHRDVDAVLYNAAALHYAGDDLELRSIGETDVEVIRRDIEINLTGALVTAHAILPIFEARGHGTLLFTGGGLALAPMAELLTLSVGKAGIRAITQALFEPAAKRGVHVATMTVAQVLKPGSDDARAVGEGFYRLAEQPKESWNWELMFPAATNSEIAA